MKIVRKCFAIVLVVVWTAAVAAAAEKQLPSQALVEALVDEVSGEIAFGYTMQIFRYDRIQANEGWHDAAVWIKNELNKMGYQDAVIESWPSNGSTRYFTTKTPIGWRAKKGELWMVKPRREKLCSYEEVPLTLIKHSGSGHVEAELVDVGSGDDEASYKNQDVKGKIVLATGSPGAIMREAVIKRGAVGVVGWYAPDTRPGYPNMIRYSAVWPTWEDRNKIGFGFNVSKLQGWTLKKMLDEGTKVVLKADVDAEFFETKVEALSASFPGSEEPQKEVLLVGHLCHPMPSANDNGSGSGGMLEMARALKKMVEKGAIKPPRRTIRFLWIPEFAGTVPYIKAHLERTRNTLAVINCDMIGENLSKTGGAFTVTQTPDSIPSFLNDVAVHFTRIVDDLGLKSLNGSDNPFSWRAAPYGGGSDHYLFNDGALRVPAVMFGHPDIFHHTSLDTMDKVDASELRRVSTIALGSMIYLASAANEEARDMALLVSRNGAGRFSENYYDSLAALQEAETPNDLQAAYKQVQCVIDHAAWRESQAVLSTLNFARNPSAVAAVKAIPANLAALAAAFKADGQKLYADLCLKLGVKPVPIARSDAEKALSRVIPIRSGDFVCPLDSSYLEEKLGPGALAGIRLRGNASYEALNFVDGKRSVADICRSVSAEFGPVPPESIAEYFKILEKAGLMKFKTW